MTPLDFDTPYTVIMHKEAMRRHWYSVRERDALRLAQHQAPEVGRIEIQHRDWNGQIQLVFDINADQPIVVTPQGFAGSALPASATRLFKLLCEQMGVERPKGTAKIIQFNQYLER